MLAHLFLNHLLDVEQAFNNFTFLYYQQPLNAMTPESLDPARPDPADPATRRSSARPQFKNGLVQGPLSDKGRDPVGERVGGGQVGMSGAEA